MGKAIELVYPLSWDYRKWRKFFLIAGLWNVFGSLPGILFPTLQFQRMYGFETNNFYILNLQSIFLYFVLVFGIGYLIVARDPGKNVGIVVMGIIGKAIVVVYFYYFYLTGKATLVPVFGGTADAIFTLYFIYYLMKGPRAEIQT